MILYQKPVVLCIGTSSVVGDSLGPLVGDLLVERFCVDAFVYGRSDRPVNGLNYPLYVAHVKKHHADSFVIAVDACLGAQEDVGKVKLSVKGLRAGAALRKELPVFGDIGVLGVVARRSNNNLSALLSADAETVKTVAQLAAEKVSRLINFLRLNYSSEHIL